MGIRSIRPRFVLAAAVCALAVVACGDDDGEEGRAGSAGASTATDVLGPSNPAKGEPIPLAGINFELNPAGSFPQVRHGAQAAVRYVNEHLGGIGGRPLELDVCLTDGSPAKSTACANKHIKSEPVAILGLMDVAGAQTLPLYDKAGLAMLGGGSFTPAESSAPNSVIFNDIAQASNADLGSFAVEELDAKKVAIVHLDDPQVKHSISYTERAIRGAGGESRAFPLPQSQADATSVVSAATEYEPDAYVINGVAQCVAILQALKNLGNTKPVLAIEPCARPDVIEAAGAAAEGMYFFRFHRPLDGDEPEGRITTAAIEKYAPKDTPLDSLAVNGFASVMNLYNLFKGDDPATLTSARMLEMIKSAGRQKSWLAADYECNGEAWPTFPSLCSTAQYSFQIKDGKPVLRSDEPYDGGPRYIATAAG
jgi:branched-chain amino acid transport system substrate-binding protein